MNPDESPCPPGFTPPIKTYRNDWWRVLWRALLCLLAGMIVSRALTGKRGGAESIYWLFSRPGAHGAERVARGLLFEKFTPEFIPPDEEREYMKQAFARQLQGMTWTWDGELKPGQP